MKAKNIKELIEELGFIEMGVDRAGLLAEETINLIKNRIKELEKEAESIIPSGRRFIGKFDNDKAIRIIQIVIGIKELKKLLGEDNSMGMKRLETLKTEAYS